LLSPVAPQLTVHSDSDLFPEEPFERVVVQTLARSVGLTMAAAEKSATSTNPDFEPFQQAVAGGVSANLCEGIAGFFATVEPTAIELSVAWALKQLLFLVYPRMCGIGTANGGARHAQTARAGEHEAALSYRRLIFNPDFSRSSSASKSPDDGVVGILTTNTISLFCLIFSSTSAKSSKLSLEISDPSPSFG
jgi:hypothetical protein